MSGILIFKSNVFLSDDKAKQMLKEIYEQKEKGAIFVGPHIDVYYVPDEVGVKLEKPKKNERCFRA